jgi:hypothetical protein
MSFSFKMSHQTDIRSAIIYGQLLGALNCNFDGARGIMYNLKKADLDKVIKKTLDNNNLYCPTKRCRSYGAIEFCLLPIYKQFTPMGL